MPRRFHRSRLGVFIFIIYAPKIIGGNVQIGSCMMLESIKAMLGPIVLYNPKDACRSKTRIDITYITYQLTIHYS